MNIRATFLMLVSQIASLASGYGIQVFLARKLGVEGFGTFVVTFSMLMTIEYFVVAGIPNALQKFIPEAPENSYGIHKKFFKWQLFYSVLVLITAFFASPLIGNSLGDKNVSALFRIALLDVLPYAFFWYYAGFQIGLKRFEKFAIVSIVYSMFKLLSIATFVYLGLSVRGAFLGNACGSFIGMLVGYKVLSLQPAKIQPVSRHAREFIIANIVYAIGLNMLYYIDIWFVKRYCSEEVVGFYGAASTLSRIPYVFSIALTGMILPTLSAAVAKKNEAEIRQLIEQSLRIALVLFVPAAVLVQTWGLEISTFIFGGKYSGGIDYLKILFPGLSLLALFSITNTMLMADRGMKICGMLVVGLAICDVGLNVVLVPRFTAQGAAAATTITLVAGLIVSAGLVFKNYHSLVQIRTMVRVIMAAAVSGFLSWLWVPQTALTFIAGVLGFTIVYFALLLVMGEVSQADIQKVRQTIIKKFS